MRLAYILIQEQVEKPELLRRGSKTLIWERRIKMIMEKSLSRIQGKEEGFTLVELLIVVAIIAILAAIAIPQFSQYRKRGYVAMLNADAKNAYTAAQAFLIDNPNTTTPTIANLQTAGYTPSAGVTPTTNMTISSGTITITGGAWGLTTSQAIIDFNGSVTPAAP